ncbi:unnamed protein product [Symbiodinium sp. CCMP2592]|nr:unnamed protein product [Symbiodinium sp. CCMP2592]CAE7282739.1 unnamed protein product [Symbiodinium sp. CCMP2592]
MAPKLKTGTRGPARKRDSPIKLCCAYKRCKSGIDVKNIGKDLQVKKNKVNLEKCRDSQHAAAKVIRFCCLRHKTLCLNPKPEPAKKRGPRTTLNKKQILHLMEVLRQDGAPWVCVAILIQLALAERGGATMQCRFRWLQNLAPEDHGVPQISVEKVNRKTNARDVPIPAALASLLHRWLHDAPLCGCNSQWPFQNQDTAPDNYLFASRTVSGERVWNQPMTREAYQLRLRRASEIIGQERANTRQAGGEEHCFEKVDLTKIGTHTFKRSSITLLSAICTSPAVLEAISATSSGTLDRYYDDPTPDRQIQALDTAFGPVWRRMTGKSTPLEAASTEPPKRKRSADPSDLSGAADVDADEIRFCARCGEPRTDLRWKGCPFCCRPYK